MRDYNANFTPELCAQLTFHMIKDSRFFFSVELRVEDIEKNCRGEDVKYVANVGFDERVSPATGITCKFAHDRRPAAAVA